MHKKNFDIEKLRAIGVIYVILWHSSDIFLNRFGIRTEWFGSWTGVDLFFCISGYVICRSLLAARQKLKVGTYLGSFYIRRILRILPSAFVCIFASVSLAFVMQRFGGRNFYYDTARDAIPALFDYANIADFYKTNNHGGTLLGIFWSLSLEEQFYLVIPLLVWFFRRDPRWLVPILLPIALWQFFLDRAPWQTLAWSIRTDGLIYGVLIAVWQHSFKKQFSAISVLVSRISSKIAWIVMPILCFSLAIICSERARDYTRFSTGWAAILGGIMVSLASFDFGLLFPGRVASSIFLWIGSRSYSLYLYHNLVLVMIKGMNLHFWHVRLYLNNPVYYGLLLVATGMLAGVSEANYQFIEVPLRKFGGFLAAKVSGDENVDTGRRR